MSARQRLLWDMATVAQIPRSALCHTVKLQKPRGQWHIAHCTELGDAFVGVMVDRNQMLLGAIMRIPAELSPNSGKWATDFIKMIGISRITRNTLQ